ncbi:MAG: hydrogenase iron-sulfur subunit [Halobacteriota archaeon]
MEKGERLGYSPGYQQEQRTRMAVKSKPRILIFAAEMAYRAADQTGLAHKEYPVTTYIVRIPCSSMIRPELVYHALEKGFDGVFIASSGDDCPFMGEKCIEKTSKASDDAQAYLKERGIEVQRVKSGGICSSCMDALVKQIKDFDETLSSLGPLKGVIE